MVSPSFFISLLGHVAAPRRPRFIGLPAFAGGVDQQGASRSGRGLVAREEFLQRGGLGPQRRGAGEAVGSVGRRDRSLPVLDFFSTVFA